MTSHEFVASDRLDVFEASKEIEKQLHQSVSSEGESINFEDTLIASDFVGKASQGENYVISFFGDYL